MSDTNVSWRWDFVVFRWCNQNPTLSQRQIDVKYWRQPDFHFQPKCNVCPTSCPTSTWRYIDVWCLLGSFHFRHRSTRNEKQLKMYSLSGYIQDVDEFVSSSEQIWRHSAFYPAHRWILCSEWVPSESIKTSQESTSNPHDSSPSVNVLWSEKLFVQRIHWWASYPKFIQICSDEETN